MSVSLAGRGQDQHRHIVAARACTAQHLHAIEAGQREVQHHRVIVLRLQKLIGLQTVADRVGQHAGLAHARQQRADEVRVVFDQQDTHRRRRRSRSKGCGAFAERVGILRDNGRVASIVNRALERRAFVAALPAALVAACPAAVVMAQGVAPSRYPSRYPAMVAAATREGAVVVHSTTDAFAAAPLIEDFNAVYPNIAVRYQEYSSAEIYSDFLGKASDAADRPDVLWSSAMDLQVKLVNDGHAQRYSSPEAQHLPSWAIWKDEAYGTTFEPVGFAYDKRQLAAHEVPHTRRDFVRLIESDPLRFMRKVVTYDLENSGLGFLLATQDAKTADLLWDVARALGKARAREVPTTAAMLQSLASGESCWPTTFSARTRRRRCAKRLRSASSIRRTTRWSAPASPSSAGVPRIPMPHGSGSTICCRSAAKVCWRSNPDCSRCAAMRNSSRLPDRRLRSPPFDPGRSRSGRV